MFSANKDFNLQAVAFEPLRSVKMNVNHDQYNLKLKTEICKNWMCGKCDFGDRCNFAHGESELVSVTRFIPCKNWTKYGRCPYGDKCHFEHVDNVDQSTEGSSSDDDCCPRDPKVEKEEELETIEIPQTVEERRFYVPGEDNQKRIIPWVPHYNRVRPVKRRLPIFEAIERKGLQELVEKIKC